MTPLEASEKVQEIINNTDWRARYTFDVVPHIELRALLTNFVNRVNKMQPRSTPVEEDEFS